jgi:lipopolysaccharide export system protein LptA
MRRFVWTATLAAWAAAASAQMLPGGSGDDFKTANVQADAASMNFETRQIDWLRGNAYIELIPATPDKPTLKIRAQEITFEYAGDATQPSSIVMTGGVNVDQPPYVIQSDRAEWQGSKMILTGNPVTVKDEKGGTYRGSKMTFDQGTGKLDIADLKIVDMQLGGAAGGAASKEKASPYLFSVADIKDFQGLLGKLKAQGEGKDPSPGKQLLARLGEKDRADLARAAALENPNAGTRQHIVGKLNNALDDNLYDAEAWKGIEIGAEAEALLKKGKSITPAERIQLNRRLLEAAYPDAIARRE